MRLTNILLLKDIYAHAEKTVMKSKCNFKRTHCHVYIRERQKTAHPRSFRDNCHRELHIVRHATEDHRMK